MRKMSKAAKAEAYDALKSERDALSQMVFMLANVTGPNGFTPDAVETFEASNTEYEFRLYGAKRANGGILLTKVHSSNMHAHTDVAYFDAWLAHIKGIPSSYSDEFAYQAKIAAERLERKRREIFEKEVADARR